LQLAHNLDSGSITVEQLNQAIFDGVIGDSVINDFGIDQIPALLFQQAGGWLDLAERTYLVLFFIKTSSCPVGACL